LADLLVRAAGIIELLAKFVSFAVVVGFSNMQSLLVFGVNGQYWTG